MVVEPLGGVAGRRGAMRAITPSTGYGVPSPAYEVPTWNAPLAQAQYAGTRAADRAARYASRVNRANAQPQQHHLAQCISLGNLHVKKNGRLAPATRVARHEANFRTLDITRLNELCLASSFD
jgi:hypothetical protein